MLHRAAVTSVAIALLALHAQAQNGLPALELVGSASGPAGRFGSAVAVDGARVVVGAPESSALLPAAGQIEVFERASNGAFASLGVFAGTNVQSLVRFGGWVDIDGDVVAASYSLAPQVEVFERTAGGAFALLQTVTAPDPSLAGFGRSLALAGNELVVASPASGFFSTGPGTLSIFARSPGQPFAFVETLAVPAPFGSTTAQSIGTSLAFDGDVLAIGDPRATATPFQSAGRVFVFERQSGGGWAHTQTLTAAVSSSNAFFGHALALDGDRIAVGVPGENLNSGSVHVFERAAGGPFVLAATVVSPATGNGSSFGSTVALDGERLAVGEPAADLTANNAGAVRLFERTGTGAWAELVALVQDGAVASEQLGNGGAALALEGGLLVAGLQTRSGFAGAAELFDVGGLYRDRVSVSLAAGGHQALLVRAGAARGGHAFLVLGSRTGTSPGVALAPGVELPLVADAYTNLGLALASPVQPALGLLDGAGRAATAFVVPAGAPPAFAGATFHHACITIDLATFAVGATNAVSVELAP